MKHYIEATSFSPITRGENIGQWRSEDSYNIFENEDDTGAEIIVHKGDISNGADVPPPWIIFLITLLICVVLSWFFVHLSLASHIWVSFSVALTTAWLLPRVHAEYIAAVFIHDVGLTNHRHLPRATIDKIFLCALLLTTHQTLDTRAGKGTWRLIRPYVLYFGVTSFGIIKERLGYFKPQNP